MKHLTIRNKEKKIKALAIYQIIGGVLGFAITTWVIMQTPTISGLIIILFLVALALYSLSTLCGTLLIKKHKYGLILSLVNQYLQLVNFVILGFGFKYVSGMLFSAGVDLTTGFDMKINYGIVSTWEFNITGKNERMEIHLNLVALFIIIFIERLRKELVQEETEMQLSGIGE